MTAEDLVRDPHTPLRRLKEGGGRVAGYVCSYVPVELLHAAGFTPVRLLSGPAPGETAGAFMQPFCCSFARSLLEGLGDGTCDYLSVLVMPHTCDTIRNLSDLVGVAVPGLRVLNLMVPTVTHTPEALEFMTGELRVLAGALADISGTPVTEESLGSSIGLYNRCRAALAGLRDLRLSNRELYAAYLAFQLMDPEDFLALVSSMKPGGERTGLTKVAVVGGPVPQVEIFELMEEYGLEAAWDDLCTASRFAEGPVDVGGDLFAALAGRYLGRRPCPTKLDPSNRREEALLEAVEAGGLRGVVFAQQAFCEFHSFDYPGLKRALDDRGIPSVRLDLETPFSPTGQLRTRLQAFSEMLTEGGGGNG